MIGFYIHDSKGGCWHVASIGILFTFKAISKCMPETFIIILGCVAFMARNIHVMLAFAKTTLAMFLTCVPAFFIGVVPAAITSYVSKLALRF